MQNLQEYKCPCCSGAIAFDSTLQKMKCPFCDTEFEMEVLKGYDAELQNEKKTIWNGKTMPEETGRREKPTVCAPMCASPAEVKLSAMPTQQLLPVLSATIPW